jgi:pimeloyl-ACP methyl ester carboxylesterase
MTDGPARTLAFHKTDGTGPTIVFLPGYASDMEGSKALALEAWAKANNRAFLRFDYAGCGASPGEFEEQKLAGWRDDVVAMLEAHAGGPAVLAGSSMGGWLMLLVARDRPDLVAGLVGIAAAPDFTDWGFTPEQKAEFAARGRVEEASPYSDRPTIFTRAFWESGEANHVLADPLPIDVPVRLLHGQRDPDVPWQHSVELAARLRSGDVQTWLVKHGDHRLSREPDIALLIRAVEDVLACL